MTANGLIQHYTGYDQNAPYIHPDNRWYVNTGSFCRLYVEGVSGYAERAGYDPMEIGFPVLRVRDGKIQGIRPDISGCVAMEYDAVKDSGKGRKWNTGSVRDTRTNKGRYDLLPVYAIKRLAQHFEHGAVKYGDRNWEKGNNH